MVLSIETAVVHLLMDYRYFSVSTACTFNSHYDGPIRKLSKITQRNPETLFPLMEMDENFVLFVFRDE